MRDGEAGSGSGFSVCVFDGIVTMELVNSFYIHTSCSIEPTLRVMLPFLRIQLLIPSSFNFSPLPKSTFQHSVPLNDPLTPLYCVVLCPHGSSCSSRQRRAVLSLLARSS